MSKAIELTLETFEDEVLKSDLPVLVDFWAPWCVPCRMMGPVLDELSGELAGKVKIAKIDVDQPAHQALASKYDVRGIPNMQLFRGGAVAKTFVGMMPKDELLQGLQASL